MSATREDNVRKLFGLAILLAFGFMSVFTGTALAQKKHAPKPVWGAMVAGLNDIQGIAAALTVFDMKRAATIADGLVARETYISNIASLPDAVKKGHAKVADEAKMLADAARAGEEQKMATRIGAVLAACSACHYDLRDAERRKKMK